jgi:hypothetical protein
MHENSVCVILTHIKLWINKNPTLNYARDTATLINLIILGLMLAYIKRIVGDCNLKYRLKGTVNGTLP